MRLPPDGGRSLYFAYGSNLLSQRMTARVPSARSLCVASAEGFRLCFSKPGRDGSGKATLVASGGSLAWGVVYTLDPEDWARLDACEPGYRRVDVRVTGAGGEALAAQTYLALETAADPVPFAWYKRCLIEGAREHGLPASYLAELEGLPERPDPDSVSGAASRAAARRP